MADKPSMDRLTGQLYHLPAIIGGLGISIANAQKALNADYVESITKLMGLIQATLGRAQNDEDAKARAAAISDLLQSLAPSRYQFTETTIDFSADLSETFDSATQVGLGVGTSAVVLNAAYSKGFGYDYRAAARITSVLHAYQDETGQQLIQRAGNIRSDKLAMPALSKVEADIWNSVSNIYNSLLADDNNAAPGEVDPDNPPNAIADQ